MARIRQRYGQTLDVLHKHRGLIFPVAAASLIFVILVPLPPALINILLMANITLAAVILLTTIYVTSPLEFSVFPSLLLATTLVRLVLNVATTRLILTAGDGGRSIEEAERAAGDVILVFSQLVASNSLTVGLIIFIILVVIQFVVITKGATRISEVAARFTLDGMPGKQMAIDADLNAGLITDVQARDRRSAISRESDFYGAMDGASKFVRGDAIAGIVITLVNIIGGLVVGMVQYGWSIGQAADLYTRLTIGDGLVSQIPAFIISVSAGLIVTRSTAKTNLGEELIGQLTSRPIALVIAAGFLGMLMLTGLPKPPLIVLGVVCIALARFLGGQQAAATAVAKGAAGEGAPIRPKAEPPKAEDMLGVDPMQLEVGYGLVRLVDAAQGGDLLDRIANLRRQIATEVGLLVPPIRIRDNMQLDANTYVVRIRDVEVARGQVSPGQLLAMDSGAASGKLIGEQTAEPAFGLPAVWINPNQKDRAEMLNYTVVDAGAVLATHLTELIRRHGHRLLTREQVNRLLEKLKDKSPNLVDEVVPELVKPGQIQKVLANLLRERVPIRDLETIVETLADWIGRTDDLDVLTEYVRNALARSICQQYRDGEGKLWCVTLDPGLEDTINAHIERSERGMLISVPPQVARQVTGAVADQLQRLVASGHPPVVLCSPPVRMAVRRLLEPALPNVAVLGYNEIDGVQVESSAMVTV
ncbi:MAG: flagellar biosynthesis protein FlhA [Planctomycetes bacterium]|nr:flagellar biosynthesis protein FlhA [Planctomycetota bacterium]